jgi:MoaA/NifB/PqqE/SkfB family radical SAM enzyme
LHDHCSIKPAGWLSRFPEIVSGRFLSFALIISGRPQNLCRFHLIYYERQFTVGLRTNGYLAPFRMKEINKCENSVGYSIHSLDPDTNYKIMGRRDIPDWDTIIPKTKNCRVQIVVNRHNIDQIDDLLKFIARYDNVKYIQVRRISTDTRYELLQEDIDLYERFFDEIRKNTSKPVLFIRRSRSRSMASRPISGERLRHR